MPTESNQEAKSILKGLIGYNLPPDQLYRVTGPNFVCGFTAYNEEITGYAPLLAKLFKKEILVMYGARTKHFIKRCLERKWKVEQHTRGNGWMELTLVEDR